MAALGSLVVELSANIAKFESAMNRASYVSNQSMKQIQGSISSAKRSIEDLVAAVGGLYVINRIWEGFKGITEAEHNLEHMAERIGVSVEQLSEMQYAAKRSGVELEGFNTGITRFEKNLSAATLANEQADTTILGVGESSNKAAQALRELGLTASVMIQLPLKEQLFAIAQRMDLLPTSADKVRVGMDLFGRSAANIITMLKQGPEVIQSFIDRGKQLGVVLGSDVVKRGSDAAVSLEQLQDAIKGLGITLVDIVGPGITKFVDGLTGQIVAARESGRAVEIMNKALEFLEKLWSEPALAAIRNGLIAGRLFGIQGAAIGAAAGFAGLSISIQELSSALQNPAVLALLGGAAGSRLGAWGAVAGGLAGAVGGIGLEINKQTKEFEALQKYPEQMAGMAAAGVAGAVKTPEDPAAKFKESMERIQKAFTTPTRMKPEGAGGGKGGGGAEAAASRLENFIKTMQEQTAKASGDSLAALDAWYDKQVESLKQIEVKTGESLAAREALQAAYNSKREALEEDYNLFIAKESGNAYVEIEAQAKSWLTKYQGFADAEENIAIIKNRKIWDQQAKDYEEQQNLIKGYFDSLAQVSPELATQLGYQERSLAIESDLAFLKIDQLQNEYKITEAMADEMRGMQALVNQARQYNLEREKWKAGGIAGGLRMGAYELGKTAESWQAEQISSWIKGAPQQISTYLAQQFIDGIKTGKVDLQATFIDLGYTTAQTILQKFIEGWLNQLLPLIANSLSNIFSGIGGGGGGGGFFGSLFGSLFGGGGGSLFESIGYVPGMGYHSGGIVKAHGGLAADEVPAILQTGERVLSRSQNAAYERGTQVNVTVINNSKAQVEPQVSNQGNDIRIMLEDAIEQSIRGGKGYRAIRQTFNLNPSTVGRQ